MYAFAAKATGSAAVISNEFLEPTSSGQAERRHALRGSSPSALQALLSEPNSAARGLMDFALACRLDLYGPLTRNGRRLRLTDARPASSLRDVATSSGDRLLL